MYAENYALKGEKFVQLSKELHHLLKAVKFFTMCALYTGRVV